VLQTWQGGKRLLSFNGLTADVTCVQFSDDGARLVAASRTGAVRVWDASTGECVHSRVGDGGPIVSLSLSSTALLALAQPNAVVFARLGLGAGDQSCDDATVVVDRPARVRFSPATAGACYVASLDGWLAVLSHPRP